MQLRNGKIIQEEKKEKPEKKQTDKKQPGKDKEEGLKEAPTGSGGGGGATKKQTNKTDLKPKPKPKPKPAVPATQKKKQPAQKKPPAKEESEDEEGREQPPPARPVKKQPAKAKEVEEEATKKQATKPIPKPSPKPAALAMGICGLCLGCSQTPDEDVDIRFRHSRESSPLAEVRKDVENFHRLLESHFHADAKKFVGQDGKGWMTTNRFMGLLKDHLFKAAPGSHQTYYALYVLYYAGHGSKTDGSFEMERGQHVTLDAILNAWEQSTPYKANASKLLIVADSCFSGKLVAELRKRATGRVTRMTDAARTVAIQATCGPNEVAWDGNYIPAYLHQIEKTQRVMERRLEITNSPQFRKQRPEYYCHWGGGEISTGPKGKPIPFFEK